MSNKVQNPKIKKPAAPNSVVQAPLSSDNRFMFQIFFLAQNQSQDVEILETKEIDIGEITQRLKLGESVFIKYKNQEMLDFQSNNKDGESNSWYFTQC
jgi:hypothetical protein